MKNRIGNRHIQVFRPIPPGRHGGRRSSGQKGGRPGKGFGMVAASVGVPLLMNIINKL